MYKVFVNDRTVILTDNYDDYNSTYDTLFIHYASREALLGCVILLRDSDVMKKLVVFHSDLEELWGYFKSNFKYIKTAGGVVSMNDKILMIRKNDHWDLPKGKADDNESIEETAKREVQEECGLTSLTVVRELPSTHHIYNEGNDIILKKTNWFLMSSGSDGPLKPDSKEGITEVKWMDSNSWTEDSKKSYLSVVEIVSSLL